MSKVSVYESFDQLPSPYREAFDKASTSSVFSSLAWFEHLGKSVFGHRAPALVYGVEHAACEAPCLILPLWSHGGNFLTPRVLASAANFYTPLYVPIIHEPQDGLEDKWTLLANVIANARPGWDMVNLHPMNPDSGAFMQMTNAFRRAGMLVDSYFCFGNWYLEVGNRSYADYLDSLPSQLANTLRRKSKQADKAGRFKIDVIVDETGLAEGIPAYESVYNSSWKVPEAYPAFMPGLIRLCAERRWLRLGLAYMDDRPVAAQIWIVSNGVASIYKLAYDQKFANLSAGSLLTARLMEHVIDVDRVREVDFLSGDDPYKRDWMSGRRERHGIVAFNPRTVRGALAALRHFGARTLKSCYRRLGRRDGASTSLPLH